MKRQIFKQLSRWKKQAVRKPLLLQGARQVGKTWLLKEFGRQEFRRAFYVNFENTATFQNLFRSGLRPSVVIPQLSILLNETIIPGQDLLIFDEIQNSADALTSIKYFKEEMPELALCCAGSHVGLAVSAASFPVGQVEFMSLYPLSFEEFLGATDERAAAVIEAFGPNTVIPEAIHGHLWEQLKIYYVTGGLPEAVEYYRTHRDNLQEALSGVRTIQRALLQGYQSDFSKHAGKVNAVHINRVLEAVPTQMLRVVDDSVGRFRFRGVIPERSKFTQLEGPIDWLVKTGLILKVPVVEKPMLPLRAFAKPNLFKLYLFDVGMLGCMLDLPIASILNQDYGTYKGYYAENLVAQEMTTAGHAPLYSWFGRQSEIEFLMIRESDVIPVEVKAGIRAHSRSLSAYAEKYSPPLKIKVTARNLDRTTPECHNIPLYLAGKL
ncbi:MAG: AAA family ATPase [bacterium]